jgi:hypothetical protein
MMQLSTARSTGRHPSPAPSVTQVFLAMGAAVGVALVAAYQAVVLLATEVGTLAALPLGLLTFIVVGAIALVAAARLDAGFLSRP